MQSNPSEVAALVVAPKYDYSCYTVVYSEDQLKKAVEDARKEFEVCHNTKIESIQITFQAALDDAKLVNQSLEDTCKVYQLRLSKYSDTVQELINKSSDLTEQLTEKSEEHQKLLIENERLNAMIQLMLKTEKELKERNKKISNAYKDSNKACRAMENVIAGLNGQLEALSLNMEAARSLALAGDRPVAVPEPQPEERTCAAEEFALEKARLEKEIDDLVDSKCELIIRAQRGEANNEHYLIWINALEKKLEETQKKLETAQKDLETAQKTGARLEQSNQSLRIDAKRIKGEIKQEIFAQVQKKLVECQEFACVAEEFLTECKPYVNLAHENFRLNELLTELFRLCKVEYKDQAFTLTLDEQITKKKMIIATNENKFLMECLKTQQVFIQKYVDGTKTSPHYRRCLELEKALKETTDELTEREIKVKQLLSKIEDLKGDLSVKTEAHAKTKLELKEKKSELEQSKQAYKEVCSKMLSGVNGKKDPLPMGVYGAFGNDLN